MCSGDQTQVCLAYTNMLYYATPAPRDSLLFTTSVQFQSRQQVPHGLVPVLSTYLIPLDFDIF